MSRLFGPVAIIITLGIALGFAPGASAQVRPPQVTIATPTAGGAAAGTVTVKGGATGRRIRRVWIAVDGASYVPASGTTSWSSPLNTTSYPDGTHILHAKVRDALGHTSTKSISVNFTNSHPSPGPQTMTTPEGTVIDVNSAGPWTADQIYQLLKANGLNSTVGPTLTVKVQDTYPSQVTTSSGTDASGQPTYAATLYLLGVNSAFAATPDAVVGHEFGHVWTLYYLTMAKHGDWTSYLKARGIYGDSRLNSSYEWMPREIIADDYRLLFGSASAISEAPHHLNQAIPDPRNVAGLKDFLQNSWTSAS